MTATDSSLSVRSASEAIILVSLGTDYFDKDGVGQSLEKYLSQAESKDFSTLRREHTLAYRSLFDRVSLDLGKAKGIIFRSMSVWPLSLKIRTIRVWRLYISSSVDIY